ncbi:MAG: T9SS type A sorting domain-containing protein [Bacteroidetes bacterium]|nr:T9SS type A sorting domain-containing protein [Bacteroidota bacterium]
MIRCKMVIVRRILMTIAVSLVALESCAASAPQTPQGVITVVGDRCVILHWNPVENQNVAGYYVFRQADGTGGYVQLVGQPTWMTGFADKSVKNDTTYSYYVKAVNSSNQVSDSSSHVTAVPHSLTDTQFLDFIQESAVDFFWYEANPANGLIKDRSTQYSDCSIASVGFGLTAICIGMDHGWIPDTAGRDRVLTTLKTFWTLPQGSGISGYAGYKGFFYHFLNMQSGLRSGDCELSSIDTALLLAGILYCRNYFTSSDSVDTQIRELADSIYNRVDWSWMQAQGSGIYMQWTPENHFNGVGPWIGYDEAMIMNTLAAGSPTHRANGENLYLSWTSGYSWQTLYGYSFLVFPPLFGHQYSECWIDYRNIEDSYMKIKGITYFENSRRATLADRAYCAANPGGFAAYSDSIWGLTASDDPGGYLAHGAPPAQNDNGTIAPTAAGGSIVFTPTESIAALRAMYDTYRTQLVTPYGLGDAFNVSKGWFDQQNIGIDQGPIAIMIENYRNQNVWDRFMQDKDIQTGLSALYFSPVTAVNEPGGNVPSKTQLEQNYPNPFNPATAISYRLTAFSHVTLKVYDVIGRVVETLVDGREGPGTHTVEADGSRLVSGVYIYQLVAEGRKLTRKMIIIK